MNPIQTKLITAGALFLGTLLSGIWLSSSGRPYNTGIFTIHKLIALAAVILIAVSVRNLYRANELRSVLELAAVVATGVLFLVLIVTGALLSLNITLSGLVLRVHQMAPLLALLSAALALFLLVRQVVEPV